MSEYGEPWRIERRIAYDEPYLMIVDANGNDVTVVGTDRVGFAIPLLPPGVLERIVACVNACAGATDAEVAELNDDEAVARMTGEAVVEIFDHLRTEAPPPGEIKPEEMN